VGVNLLRITRANVWKIAASSDSGFRLGLFGFLSLDMVVGGCCIGMYGMVFIASISKMVIVLCGGVSG